MAQMCSHRIIEKLLFSSQGYSVPRAKNPTAFINSGDLEKTKFQNPIGSLVLAPWRIDFGAPMGQAFRKLFDSFFGTSEMRVCSYFCRDFSFAI
jgi:hypothetical protein